MGRLMPASELPSDLGMAAMPAISAFTGTAEGPLKLPAMPMPRRTPSIHLVETNSLRASSFPPFPVSSSLAHVSS